MLHEIITGADEEGDEEPDDGGGFQVGIPGTDYHVTTDPDEANVLGPDTVRDTGGQVVDFGQERVDRTQETGGEFVETVTDTPGRVLEGAQTLADPSEPAEFVPGVTEVRERERFQEEAQRFQEADGVLGQFDAAVAAGTDFLLDHPDASVQEGTRGGLVRAIPGIADEEELAEAAQAADEGLTERIDATVEDTPLDTRATDAVRTAGDLLIAEGGRIMAGATTGVDVEEGEVGARTGALETADVGLTLGTLGVGRAAAGGARAVRSGDDLFDVGRLRRADPEDATAARAVDEDAARVADDVTAPVTRQADEIPMRQDESGIFRMTDEAAPTATRQADQTAPALRVADDAEDALLPAVRDADALAPAARVTDDATGVVARATEDVAGVGARVTDRATDAGAVGARTADDVGSAAARATEDLAGADARITDRVSDAVRGVGDTFGMAGTRAGQAARRAAGSRPARFGAAGAAIGAGIVGGGALIDQLRDRYEMANGTVLVKTDTFPETDRFDGGVLFAIEENGDRLGYTVVVGEQGRNIIMLDSQGNPMRAPLSTEELQERAIGPGDGG